MNVKDSLNSKQRIIDAAAKLISEKGYHGATTDLIAKEAGVSQGLIFHYFKSKEGLFFSLLKEKSKTFKEEFEKSTGDEKDVLKKIEIAVLTYARLIQKEEKFYEILIKQSRGSGLDFDKINKYGLMESAKLIGELIRTGIEQGVLRELDFEVAASSLFGMIEQNALRWMILRKNFSLEEAIKEAMDIFRRGVIKS